MPLSPATSTAVIETVLQNEGGVGDIGDGAGVTSYGQTIGWCRQYGLQIPLTREEAAENYQRFLLLEGLDELPDDLSLATVVVDYAVNSGATRAIKALQTALGFVGKEIDGVIGDQTIHALTAGATDYRDPIARSNAATIRGGWQMVVTAHRLDNLGEFLGNVKHPERQAWANGLLRRVARVLRGPA